jgi:ABC-type antimicrobial peptide transport system permease subunit
MATQKLMPERISRTEERPLSNEDVALLKAKRNKQLTFLLSGYLPFIAFGLFILFMGPYSLNTPRRRIMGEFTKINIDDAEKIRFWTVAPWFLGFMFILLSIYFARLYFQSLKPLSKDIKLNKKQLLFFKPVKNSMAFFNKYYLSTPLYQNQQIEVSREAFESINDNDELHLEVGPDSTFIFRLCNGNKEIKYY